MLDQILDGGLTLNQYSVNVSLDLLQLTFPLADTTHYSQECIVKGKEIVKEF